MPRSTSEPVGDAGLRPPQQARSRAALQRLLAAAEYVLAHDGIEEFTIARVAEHAGVSVGGVYRRFTSKEQLLDAVGSDLLTRFEHTVSAALDGAEPSVAGVLDAFTSALGQVLAASGHVIPALLSSSRSADTPLNRLGTVTTLQERFTGALAAHRAGITHPDPDTATNIAFRTVIGSGIHRAAAAPLWPDGLTWAQWAREITDMTTAYLTAQRGTETAAH